MIACQLNVPFVPVRKQGKLPGECISAESIKEYGKVHECNLFVETKLKVIFSRETVTRAQRFDWLLKTIKVLSWQK